MDFLVVCGLALGLTVVVAFVAVEDAFVLFLFRDLVEACLVLRAVVFLGALTGLAAA